MKDAAPNPTLSVDNNTPHQSKIRSMRDLERQEISTSVDNVEVEDAMAMGRPTIEDIERWDATKLAKWIQQVLDPPLYPDDAEKIIDAEIYGRVFLKGAGDRNFFQAAGLSFGTRVKLSELAKGFTSTAIRVSYYLSYHIQMRIRPS